MGLAAHFGRVVATDASAAQVQRAAPHPSVEYRVAPAERSGLDRHSVDLVTVGQAAHWFDLPRFFDEVRRVCRPGGVVALWTYDLCQVDPAVDKRWTNVDKRGRSYFLAHSRDGATIC